MSFRWEPPLPGSGYTPRQKRAVVDIDGLPRGSKKRPVVSVHRDGERSYIWIGDDNGPCYGVVSGAKDLREFAKAILKCLEYRPPSPPTKKRGKIGT